MSKRNAMPEVGWQTENLYYLPQDYFKDLIECIDHATETIEIETYIFDCDEFGVSILNELIVAANRGIKVRLIVDGIGSFFQIPKLISILSSSPIQFKIYNPFLFPYATNQWRWLRIDLIIKAFSHMNSRLHRKICLVDNKILFLGSFNITDRSNRDSGVRVTGNNIHEVSEAFESIWRTGRKFHKAKNSDQSKVVRLNNTNKMRKLNNYDLGHHIRSAKHRIWITNAYFVPPLFVLNAIYIARKNGLDVQVLIPSRSNLRFMKLLTETYYRGLLQVGVRIFEYEKAFLHAKTLLVDNWALVGSSNMNHRSVFHDLEVDVVLTKESSLRSLDRQFEIDRRSSHEITIENFTQRRFLDRLLSWFICMLRNWL